MERSLVLLKPDVVQRGLNGAILDRLERLGLKLIGLKLLWMDEDLAKKHYAPHAHKPFFPGLMAYITSGPVVAAALEGEKAVEKVRKAMGATDPAKADTGTIRGDYGMDIERNTVHGSDSPTTAEIELRLFFSEGELYNYPMI